MPLEPDSTLISSGSYLVLSGFQVLLGSCLLIFSLLLSLLLRLQLERSMGIAALRMVVQLLLVGLVMDWIFSRQHPWLILLMAVVMASIAAASASSRPKRRYPGIYWNCLISILASSFLVTGLAGLDRNFPASTLVYTAIPDSVAGDGAGQHAQRHLPGPRPFSG